MDHPEIHKAQVLTPPKHVNSPAEHHNSPIFIPAIKHQPVKLVRRGLHRRRQWQAAAVFLVVLLGAAFTYAFIVERNREVTNRIQAP